ncbi:hypothetical protein K5V21_13775 [Clostridium sardiniense]|uniref:Uncharacterized protein n=1 Tax=Clostridium sardiniense TaxID=29369 RepID=A0ABS7L0G5_CLOSR|nr:hypothetical protein [Clostridium sardiniense]MBY0756514.1 hypothetical protein [Clostridium sardiniense]MDQ0460261.1 hypothetical protein [Clostridium sardiniense]
MGVKLPFPKWILNTPVQIYQTFINEDGEPVEDLIYDGLCNYNEKSRQTLDAERRLVTLSGTVIVEGDINPDKLIEGYIKIGELKKDIYKSSRPRNPDGSVFSTELELI